MAVDPDPCQEAIRLRAIRTAIATGDTVQQARHDEKVVAYYQANLSLLEEEIARADQACAIQEGRPPKRQRYAIRGYFRPY